MVVTGIVQPRFSRPLRVRPPCGLLRLPTAVLSVSRPSSLPSGVFFSPSGATRNNNLECLGKLEGLAFGVLLYLSS
jgi:hypothetical protein